MCLTSYELQVLLKMTIVDVFWRMDHCTSRTPIDRNKADLSTASALFESAATSFNPQIEEIARLGKHLLAKLREEESVRSLTPVPHREPLAEVFKASLTACGDRLAMADLHSSVSLVVPAQ